MDGFFSCDTRIYRTRHENTALVFDSCGIFMARAVYSRITLKAIQYYIITFIWLVFKYIKDDINSSMYTQLFLNRPGVCYYLS